MEWVQWSVDIGGEELAHSQKSGHSNAEGRECEQLELVSEVNQGEDGVEDVGIDW